jgi:hypothetical protein
MYIYVLFCEVSGDKIWLPYILVFWVKTPCSFTGIQLFNNFHIIITIMFYIFGLRGNEHLSSGLWDTTPCSLLYKYLHVVKVKNLLE